MNRATELKFIAETRSGKLEICRVSNLVDLAYAHALQGLRVMYLPYDYPIEDNEFLELAGMGFNLMYNDNNLVIRW